MRALRPYRPAALPRKIGCRLLPKLLGAGVALVLLVGGDQAPPARAGTLIFLSCATRIPNRIDATASDANVINSGKRCQSLIFGTAVPGRADFAGIGS